MYIVLSLLIHSTNHIHVTIHYYSFIVIHTRSILLSNSFVVDINSLLSYQNSILSQLIQIQLQFKLISINWNTDFHYSYLILFYHLLIMKFTNNINRYTSFASRIIQMIKRQKWETTRREYSMMMHDSRDKDDVHQYSMQTKMTILEDPKRNAIHKY